MSVYHVDSEEGDLQEVVVHRPGSELGRLTPDNVDDLLFDDIMWAERARCMTSPIVREEVSP